MGSDLRETNTVGSSFRNQVSAALKSEASLMMEEERHKGSAEEVVYEDGMLLEEPESTDEIEDADLIALMDEIMQEEMRFEGVRL